MEMKEKGLTIYDNNRKLVIHEKISESRTFRLA